jgi:hypothetical protein
MKLTLKLTGALLTIAALYGCGGGDGGGPVADSYVFPAGKATLTFAAISTAHLTAPISGVDFSIRLPAGMSVTTATGGSGQIDSTVVTPGASLTGTNLAYGSYSASTRKAYLGMATTSTAYRSGEFLRLVCDVAGGSSITLADLKALNTPTAISKAVGYDSGTTSTVTLTDKVTVTLGAWK